MKSVGFVWGISFLLLVGQVYGQEAGGAPEYPVEDITPEPPYPESIWSIAWSPSGNEIALGRGADRCNSPSNDYSIIIITPLQDVIQNIGGIVKRCATHILQWSNDGEKLLESGVGEAMGIWDVNTGLPVSFHEAAAPTGFLEGFWSPNNSRIVSIEAHNPEAVIWDALSGETLLTLQANNPRSVTWNPDGTQLATTNGDITVWDSNTGQLVTTFPKETVELVRWSPNNSLLAGSLADNSIEIWDVSTGVTLLTLQGHTDEISQLLWSPDGNSLSSASYDGSVRVWDAITGTLINMFTYPGKVYALDWSTDGHQIIYSGMRSDGQSSEVEIVDVLLPAESLNSPSAGYQIKRLTSIFE